MGADDTGRIVFDGVVNGSRHVAPGRSSSSIDIVACTDAVFYIVGVVADRVVVRDCRNCRVVVGCCLGEVLVESCQLVTVSAVTRSLSIATSVSCTLFALCREPIAVQADCRNVAVGPFNAPFDGSDDIVQRFPAVLQDAASLRYVVAGSTDASPTDVVRPVDPAEFIMAPVPIGHPPPSPFPLPDAYQQALSVRESRWRSLLARLNDPSVPRADLAQARAQVDTQFRKWLEASGEITFLEALHQNRYRVVS
ncbi:C-CAP/cofactor C-like domain-containing protein [Plasmodiophora brassicae]